MFLIIAGEHGVQLRSRAVCLQPPGRSKLLKGASLRPAGRVRPLSEVFGREIFRKG